MDFISFNHIFNIIVWRSIIDTYNVMSLISPNLSVAILIVLHTPSVLVKHFLVFVGAFPICWEVKLRIWSAKHRQQGAASA